MPKARSIRRPPTPVLDATEARQLLNISKPTFELLVKDGLPRLDLSTPGSQRRNLRFIPEQIIAWAQQRQA